jgi:hypothetical protein
VFAVKASATTLEAVYKTAGVAGNGTTTTETMANGVWANGGAGMAGGTDMSVFSNYGVSGVFTEHKDDAGWNVTITAVGSNVVITVTGEANVKWKGEVEKLELL